MSVPSELALRYFQIGNAVTAFYVAQTILFLNYLYKEKFLLTRIKQQPKIAQMTTWLFAGVYIVVVLACFTAEYSLWQGLRPA